MIYNQYQSRQYQYTPRTHVRERPLHWFIILVSLLFVFLLIIESVAFIVLGAWHLTTPRLQGVLTFSTQIYRRELAFGILLVIIGKRVQKKTRVLQLFKCRLSPVVFCIWF